MFELFQNALLTLVLIKILFLVISFIFTIFLLVVLKQVNSMNRVINEASSGLLIYISILLILLSAVLFLTALVIL
ncbi:MAG: hypothetical protein A2186_01935 [Candidatus Levybacteria bacterium RIFOXYA1_FULL_41_10]|nr:MAG: hypothetical protein UT87_C0023G0018 [Candidatus Levybacteria bacterium GW2011_GWC1_40_19]KKR73299.1 MAG: hypothetical protein UU15_C0013G0002 [Candidatus Levybacteria bacterium GW2011_GWC2_40_7]KKR95165.1 MAG: hypothetical protein UU45_C0004G0068 [Candidatus Levybacteria bacterium GW2011_GWA2_41_15]OGH24681.1 MAG: hypothetical protein A3D82_00520 [Candidatus Levybacteria bacterium RIFCSPHIGHO2_02_FULL_40_29]OGH50887.1 MAG: hypothetical protein A3J18_01870 [Candidatus Levybacteria bacte